MPLDTLHIAECSIEVVGEATYNYLLDSLEVVPEWDVDEYEFASGKIGQTIGDTRLLFKLDWGYFEVATGHRAIGHMALIKKFLDLKDINLVPNSTQPATKFKVLIDFPELKQIAAIHKGTVSKGVQIPFKTEDRLSSAELQFFNFI